MSIVDNPEEVKQLFGIAVKLAFVDNPKDVKLYISENAEAPMVSTVFGSVTELKTVPENAEAPIDVRELGREILDKFIPENAESPIVVTESGIVIETNLVLSLKSFANISVVPSRIR
tara:strand:- start:1 stop:351 length:351 start_codon:yes stop_codon:yes gene_type:complete